MGAAVGVEMNKPADASDVQHNLISAKNEVMRLRHSLGHLAKGAGFTDVVFDASDLVHGKDEQEDLDRCVAEVVHIRAALRLATASGQRRARSNYAPKSFFDMAAGSEDEKDSDGGEGKSADASSGDSDSEGGEGVEAREIREVREGEGDSGGLNANPGR
jgi:hypothetical protein